MARTKTHELSRLSPCAFEFRCPAQVLVVDAPNGPAHLVIDTISRLFEGRVSVTLASGATETLHALNCGEFDLIAVGADNEHIHHLIPYLKAQGSGNLILISRDAHADPRRDSADRFVLPHRASELKATVLDIVQRYLTAAFTQ